MTQRFSRRSRDELSDEQRQVYDQIAAGPRRSVPLIFQVLLDSAPLASATQQLGALLRYRSGLAPRLSELAILTVARHWGSEYEWWHHEREARAAGVSESSIDAIRQDDGATLRDDEALIYEFARALLQGEIPDRVFAAIEARFGREVLVNLTGMVGYYSMLALVARAFELRSEEQS